MPFPVKLFSVYIATLRKTHKQSTMFFLTDLTFLKPCEPFLAKNPFLNFSYLILTSQLLSQVMG